MKRAVVVSVFAIAFAYVEAAVVEYLRGLYYSAGQGGFLFPVMTLERLQSMGAEHVNRLQIEVGRELATLVMLAAVGIMVGTNRRECWAHFAIAFGVWDIFFYIWLKVFLDWPESLMTWDLLFLLPVPWVSPVWAPVTVSVVMIVCGLAVLYREDVGRPLDPFWSDWVLLTAGGVIAIAALCWDFRNIIEGGMPNPFNWMMFLAGLGVGIVAFALAFVRDPGSGREV
jgi:hypothetical protein